MREPIKILLFYLVTNTSLLRRVEKKKTINIEVHHDRTTIIIIILNSFIYSKQDLNFFVDFMFFSLNAFFSFFFFEDYFIFFQTRNIQQ